jgi:hypothetical protein
LADLLSDLKTYFTSAQLVPDSIVFKDYMPNKPDTAVALYEYGGAVDVPQIEGATRSVQVCVRSKSTAEARTIINSLYASLQTEDGILNLTPERWTTVALRQLPFKMKTDEQDRNYYVFNVYFTTYTD